MLDDISNPSSSSALTHDNFASLLFHAVNRYKALPSGVKRASRRKEEKFRLFFSSGFLAALPFLLLLLLLLLPHPSFHFLRLLFFSFRTTTIIRKHWPLFFASTGSGSHLFLRE